MIRFFRYVPMTALAAVCIVPSLSPRSAVAAPRGRSTSPCSARDLGMSARLQGVMGSVVGKIVLRNEGKGACILAGFPRVALSVPRRGVLPVQQQRSPAGPAGFPVESTELVHGQASDVFLQWMNLCRRVSPPLRLTVTLPNGGHLRALPPNQAISYGGAGDPRCGRPDRASTVLVGSFQPAFNLAVAGLLSYYGFINRRDYADAYAMAVDPGATRARFVAGYRQTVHVAVARIAVPRYRVHRGDEAYACVGMLLSATQSNAGLRFYGGWIMTEVRDRKVAAVVIGGSRMVQGGALVVPTKRTCAAAIPKTGGRG